MTAEGEPRHLRQVASNSSLPRCAECVRLRKLRDVAEGPEHYDALVQLTVSHMRTVHGAE